MQMTYLLKKMDSFLIFDDFLHLLREEIEDILLGRIFKIPKLNLIQKNNSNHSLLPPSF